MNDPDGDTSRFRGLPSVDALLRTEVGRSIAAEAGAPHAAELARGAIDLLRSELANDGPPDGRDLLDKASGRLRVLWQAERMRSQRRVINAAGVILHTNLGRAPLSAGARAAILEASGYTNLEYDLGSGSRGRRGRYAEELAAELTGAEDAVIVNNCAAAAFIVLTVLVAGGEVIISRGELVEIGGDFRIPEVLERSGSTLREVGTTNRTKLADYERAIGENTRMILRVHPSNYRIIGFTARPSVPELAGLAHGHGLLFFEDIGSGALCDLGPYGLGDEPVIGRSIAEGADIVSFSGDKLLGGPQAGIIAGRADLIDRLRTHPLYRVLRVDKLAYAALQATLEAYRCDAAFDDIPVLKMLSATGQQLAERARTFVDRLTGAIDSDSGLRIELTQGASAIGGGAAPDVHPATTLIVVGHSQHSAAIIEARLRTRELPVIARIENEKVLIDLRTVVPEDEAELAAAITELI